VNVTSLHGVEPFITMDGSEIREVAGPPTGNAVNQSLAEATLRAGSSTDEHFHREAEEIYFITHGRGRLRVGETERDVQPGDTVVIAPGLRHKLWNTGDEPLRLLCACSPAYSHEDTVITE
jgi:mannose-6-phosphate isomerase-like protein (cupin superfamily)